MGGDMAKGIGEPCRRDVAEGTSVVTSVDGSEGWCICTVEPKGNVAKSFTRGTGRDWSWSGA